MPRLRDYASRNWTALLERIENAVYEHVEDLRVTAWSTDEPVPFARRQEGSRRGMGVGGAWGEKLFDCAWFLFEGTAPASLATSKSAVLLIDVNGELCLYDEAGCPQAGLTSVASSFDFRLGKPGKRVFEPSIPFAPGQPLRLWANGGFNDLFGRISGNGHLVEARLALRDEAARRLYYDVAFLVDYLRCLSAEAPLARRIRCILDEVSSAWESGDDDLTLAALETTARFFAMHPGRGLLRVTAVGHAHLDLAWLWPIREGKRKAVRTLATALHMAERYPEYRMAVSQAQMFDWIKEQEPELYQRVRAAVRKGILEPVGDAWVEADTNIPSGESLIRQIAHGRAFFAREFGTRSEVMFLPDVFGYSAALPQIMLGCGLKYFMTQKLSWNLVNKFPHQSFWWEGLDGSRVLAHMLPEETYNSPASASALSQLENNYREIGVSDQALMLFGIGDGGGGPGAEHLENLARARRAFGLPNAEIGRVADFFTALASSAELFPCWRGELYLERHQSTLTTQAEIKRCHRRAEVLLYETEWLMAAEKVLGGDSAPQALDAIWRDVLLFQFHDILPGSSIRRVYDEALPLYHSHLESLERRCEEAALRLAAIARPSGSQRSPVIVNPLPWTRREWIPDGMGGWQWCEVPAFSIHAASADGAPLSDNARLQGRSVSNGIVEMTLGERGGIISLRLGEGPPHEFVMPGEEMALLRVYRDDGDAWDTPLDYLRHPAFTPEVTSVGEYRDGPQVGFELVMAHGESRILQRIGVRAGSPLVFIDLEIDWRTPKTLLRAVFPCNLPAARATYEIQFGWLERATHENTSWDAARHECPHQQWVDLSNGRTGLAVLNDGKYGSVIKDQTIEMSLLRSVPYPNYDGQGGGSAVDADSRYSSLGTHRCRYALMPHQGTAPQANVWQHARAFNHPLRIVHAKNVPNTRPETKSPFAWEGDDGFDVAAFKPADCGTGVVLRVVRFADSAGQLRLRPNFPVTEVFETTMLEETVAALTLEAGWVRTHFRPFEVKTLWLR